ncbi:hypothetical protein Q5530_24190 [Saccharothrix sp. BKS2]|uniref:DUF6801 domain-containing protein n=1 Tax=Saccharothrix sp. BKS2 TaxID=3064400 RepID=UPI0039ED52CC
MSGVRKGLPALRALGVAAAVLLIGGAGAPPASAALTLRYTCSFPVIRDQPMTATITWNASDSHVVGEATPPVPVTASATIAPFVTQALTFAGATTVEGSAAADAVVTAPEGDIGVTTPLTVPVTPVPASGPMTFTAHGTARSLVFRQPGNARITLGGLALRMVPRNADGDLTAMGEVHAPCRLDAGQDGVLASFRVLPAEGSATRPTTAPPRPTAAPGPTAPGGAPTAPGGSAPARVTGPDAPDGPDPGTPGAVPAGIDDPGTPAATAPTGASATAPSTASAGGTRPTGDPNLSRLLLVAVVVPAVGAVAGGCAWWSRRRRGDGPEVG